MSYCRKVIPSNSTELNEQTRGSYMYGKIVYGRKEGKQNSMYGNVTVARNGVSCHFHCSKIVIFEREINCKYL